MASRLKLWVAATLGGCLLIGLALLPPTGAPPGPGTFRRPASTPERARVDALTREWQETSAALQVATYRESLERALAREPAPATRGARLLVGPALSASLRVAMAAGLDTVWDRLGLGSGDVRVGVAILFDATIQQPGTPVRFPLRAPAYLLPPASDGHTCLALLPFSQYTHRELFATAAGVSRRLQAWLASGLGPCAFYAAFGRPGPAVERWLVARRFDLGYEAGWDRPLDRRERRAAWMWDFGGPEGQSYWASVYAFDFDGVACAAGRVERCTAALFDTTAAARRGDGGGLLVTTPWWRRRDIVAGDWLLSDLVRERGRERFARFWRSSLPPERAFAAALETPIGEWTRRWQLEILGRPLPVAPSMPPSPALLGILLAGLCVDAVALYSSRRQIG